MPCYIYKCPSGHVIEQWRKMEDRHMYTKCDDCGKSATLTPSVTNYTFKGPTILFGSDGAGSDATIKDRK